ncbi:MAG: hypothetical protein KGI57_08950, partial [Hyphomicrobiales bacterium]|nr:hypothetical protein [Hyphomicrobiales bacterium]
VFFRPAKGAPAGVKVLHLLGGAKVDDTVFVTAPRGHVLIADTKGGTVYRLDAPAWSVGSAFSAVGPIKAGAKAPAYAAYVGAIDLHSGAAIPVASGFANPHGMAFVADK